MAKQATPKEAAKKPAAPKKAAKKPATPKKATRVKKEKEEVVEVTPPQEILEEPIPTAEGETHPRNVGDKLGEAAQKSMDAARDILEKVRFFASGATELTRLKIDVANLKSDRKRFIEEMGEKVWQLQKSGKLDKASDELKPTFQKVEDLESRISEKEKEIKKVSLTR